MSSAAPDPEAPQLPLTGEILQRLAAAAPVPLFAIDGDHRFVYLNASTSELIGCSVESLTGANLIDYIIPGERAEVASYFRSLAPEQAGHRELGVLRPDGERRETQFSHIGLELGGRQLRLGLLDDLTESRRLRREATAFANAAGRLAVNRTLNAMLDGLAQSVVEATTALASAVYLQERDGSLRQAGTFGLPEGYAEAMDEAARLGAPRGSLRAIESRAAVIEEDPVSKRLADPRFRPVHDLIRDEPWSVAVYLPLVHQEKVVGALAAFFAGGNRPPEREIDFLRAMANEAAFAVEYARLLQAQRENAALEQRQRLARELHDSISQTVYGIALAARTARELLQTDPAKLSEPLDMVLRLSEAALAEMRALIFELRPEALDREGLIGALKHHTAALRARHGLRVEEAFSAEPMLSLEDKQGLYRIAQEALHNAARHSRAGTIGVRLVSDRSEIYLEVWDDGIGFDAAGAYPGHLGLHTMQERATELGGELQIDSRPSIGTRVRVVLPGVGSPKRTGSTGRTG
ncbi:MAG TPA: histidine kinase [Candidatus Dormibacteraeota bacterium]|nr:histidine kinase [Candidatus Dormibacteraeota bacterium]